MSDRWTPGPWRVIRGDSVVNIVADETGADVLATNSKLYWQRHDDADMANAVLCSAAPDMAEALTQILAEDDPERRELSHKCIECNLGTGPNIQTCGYHLAVAALAKARGQA